MHQPSRRFFPLVAALLLAACSARSPDATGSKASSGGDGGTNPEAPPTCAPTVDFQSDPQNCGRCGRACDDGACRRGMCTSRVELTYGDAEPAKCPVDFEVVQGSLFVTAPVDAAARRDLLRVANGAGVSIAPELDAVLSTDGNELFALSRDYGKTLQRFDPAGNLVSRLITQTTAVTPTWTATDGKTLFTMGSYDGTTLDVTTGAATAMFKSKLQETDSTHYVQLVGSDLYTQFSGAVSRWTGSGWVKVSDLDDTLVDSWVVVGDRLYTTKRTGTSYAVFVGDLEGGAPTQVASLTLQDVAPLAPDDWVLDAGARADLYPVLVTDGTKAYVFVGVAGLHPKSAPDMTYGSVIAKIGDDGKLQAVGASYPAADTGSQRIFRVRDGRVYWVAGAGCTIGGGGGSIQSLPL